MSKLLPSGSKGIAIREVMTSLAMLGLACVAAVNLFCAIAYGAVFLNRGSGWAALDTNPVAFIISVAVSIILVVGCGMMGLLGLREGLRDWRSGERLQSLPRYEEPSHIARFEP